MGLGSGGFAEERLPGRNIQTRRVASNRARTKTDVFEASRQGRTFRYYSLPYNLNLIMIFCRGRITGSRCQLVDRTSTDHGGFCDKAISASGKSLKVARTVGGVARGLPYLADRQAVFEIDEGIALPESSG